MASGDFRVAGEGKRKTRSSVSDLLLMPLVLGRRHQFFLIKGQNWSGRRSFYTDKNEFFTKKPVSQCHQILDGHNAAGDTRYARDF